MSDRKKYDSSYGGSGSGAFSKYGSSSKYASSGSSSSSSSSSSSGLCSNGNKPSKHEGFQIYKNSIGFRVPQVRADREPETIKFLTKSQISTLVDVFRNQTRAEYNPDSGYEE